MSELDPIAPAIPSSITPEMASALLHYRQGAGANALSRAAISPLEDIYRGLTTNEATESEQSATAGSALQSALGFIGPMGAGKGMAAAMATLPMKKAGKSLAELGAES